MMPSNGPPTPQGVGGPTPPLVSRGSEEEGGKRISLEGLPSPGRKGYSAPTARVEEEVSPPIRDGGECPRNLKGDEESPPTHGKKGECTSPQQRAHNLRGGRGEAREEYDNSQQQRPDKATRRTHTSRELRMLDPGDKLPPKRARRPTGGMAAEATRDSNMICPLRGKLIPGVQHAQYPARMGSSCRFVGSLLLAVSIFFPGFSSAPPQVVCPFVW